MFQNKSVQLQSWLQLCDQLDMLTQQVLFERKKLKDAEDYRDKLYSQLPWFYLCRATPGQIKRYNESIADVAYAKTVLANAEERESKSILDKNALYNSMLDQAPNYRAAYDEVKIRKLLLSKGKYALSTVQDAFNQIKVAISEKEKDLIQDIKEQHEGQSSSGWRNWSVSCEFDCAKSKIRDAKQALTEFCESLKSELPEEAVRLQTVLPFIDDSIGHASYGDWWTNLDDNPLYGTLLLQKMGMVQGQLQLLISPLSSTVANCDCMCAQSISKRVQVENSFEERLISYRSDAHKQETYNAEKSSSR